MFLRNNEFLSKNQFLYPEVIKLSSSFVCVADVVDDFSISATVLYWYTWIYDRVADVAVG